MTANVVRGVTLAQLANDLYAEGAPFLSLCLQPSAVVVIAGGDDDLHGLVGLVELFQALLEKSQQIVGGNGDIEHIADNQ